MAGRTSLISSDLPNAFAAAVRTARHVDLSDPLEVIRTDLGEGIDVGRELIGDAAEALSEAVARWPGRSQRPSRRRPALVGLAIGIVAVLALAAWWLRRRPPEPAVGDERLDRASLERAADEGMGTTIGSPTIEPGARETVPLVPLVAGDDGSGAPST